MELKFRAWCAEDSEMIYKLNSPHMRDGVLSYDSDDILMQFTGLTDKNGKDIYEGDILDFDPKEWGGEFTPEVIRMEDIIGKWDLSGSLQDVSEWRAVIGNEHQSPELLITTEGEAK